jgi:CHAD domain-containing protein
MKTLEKYFQNREDDITLLLNKPKGEYTSDTFHKLRVEIKKLNALFDLINFCSKYFKSKKTFKPFKFIFSQAGKVRALQVEEVMLKKYFRTGSLKDYRNNLKRLRLKEGEIFFELANKKLVTGLKKKYRKIESFIELIDKKQVDAYMKSRQKKIEKLLAHSPLQIPQIHILRKRLKIFHYNQNSLNLLNQNKPLPKKDILTELLGKWHDCQVIIDHLQNTMDTGGINSNEIGQLKKIKTKISSDSKILFNKIKQAIPTSEFFRADVQHHRVDNNLKAGKK